MKRVLILGPGGAGKSTLARELGSRLDLRVIHLDTEFWQPGWRTPDLAAFSQRVEELIKGDRWVMDGNFTNTLQRRLTRADTVIMLELPILQCFYRILGRRVRYRGGQTRPDLAPECPEKVDWAFVVWIFSYYRDHWGRVMQILAGRRTATRVIQLGSTRAVRRFTARLEPLQTQT